MLVLDRKPGEVVFIDIPPSDTPQRIAVTLLTVKRVRSAIGIEAPREMNIVREELLPTAAKQEAINQ